MIYYLGWILLTAAGILASIGVFIWALRTGQFRDQRRARYLPLADVGSHTPATNLSGDPRGIYALAVVLVLGLLGMVGTVFLTWLHPGG